jgi:DNA-binding NarL/FixJ family response regulator
MVIAVVDDLLFSSKIRAVAQAAGGAVTFARSGAAAVEAAKDPAASLAIVDLEGRAGKSIEVIRLLREAAGPGLRIIGYGSHVNVALLESAREAGCDQAMARSAFVAALPSLLAPASAAAE